MSDLSIPHRIRTWAAQRGIALTLNNIRLCRVEGETKAYPRLELSANTDQIHKLVAAIQDESAPLGRMESWPNEQEDRKARIAQGQIRKEKIWVEFYPHRLETA